MFNLFFRRFISNHAKVARRRSKVSTDIYLGGFFATPIISAGIGGACGLTANKKESHGTRFFYGAYGTFVGGIIGTFLCPTWPVSWPLAYLVYKNLENDPNSEN